MANLHYTLLTLTHLSCSPNFSRASYLDERTLTYESIVNSWETVEFSVNHALRRRVKTCYSWCWRLSGTLGVRRRLTCNEEHRKAVSWYFNRRWSLFWKILPWNPSETWTSRNFLVERVNTCQFLGLRGSSTRSSIEKGCRSLKCIL